VNFSQFKLDSRLMAGISKSGYEIPTPVQEQAIPAALAGRDLIATAQTGTGKTATFVLPILHKLLSGPRQRARALIVTPTRELAEQINDNIRTLSAGTNLRTATIYGGVGAAPQVKALKTGVEILVACPGRLLDLASQGIARLDNVEILVLDEADRMFDMGFLPDVRRIVKLVPAKRQTMLFSATFPPEVEKLASETLIAPERIAVGLSRPAHTVSHALYPVPKHLKTALTFEILKRTDTNSVLIFTRTRYRAQSLATKLSRRGYRVTSLHSDRTQGQRQSALNGFKDGRYQIMVATDIAARGLDVDSISHVINFDIPDTADAYIHRIGRTGRAERTGDAFTLVTPDDDEMVRELEKIMQQRLPREVINGFDYQAPPPPQPIQPPPRAAKISRHQPVARTDHKPRPPRRHQ
jgi:ATP-dependent RNA helicase RhlE